MNAPVQTPINIQFDFDLTNIAQFAKGLFQALPGGMYLMQITGMEVVENKEKGGVKTGHHLKLERTVIEPAEFRGQMYIDRLNLWNTGSDVARKIAMEQLSAIGHSVGVVQGNNLGLLAYRPHVIHLGYTPAEPDTIDGNGVEKKGRPAQNETLRCESPEKYNPAMAAKPFSAQPQAAAAQPAAQPAGIAAPPGIGPNGAGIHTPPAVAPSAPPPFPTAQAPAPQVNPQATAPASAPAPQAAPQVAPPTQAQAPAAAAPQAGGQAMPPWLAGGAAPAQ